MLGYYDGSDEYHYSYQGQFDDDETEEKFKKAKYKGKINMYDNNGLPV